MKYFDTLNQKVDEVLLKFGFFKHKTTISIFERELSIFIQEFLINYEAGVTLDRALRLTANSQCKDLEFIRQLNISNNAIDGINHFAALQDRKEVWRFTRLVNQIQLTGSHSALEALSKYHDELWQSKLSLARKKSEIVTIQLTFLLMLSLISVIIVVITPIMLLF